MILVKTGNTIIKLALAFTTLFVAFFFQSGLVFACQRIDCQPRADKVKAELAELKAQGINTYIYWQYSGNNCNPWTDSNDPYSFFEGDPLCGVLKEAANSGWTIGVNAHHLSNHISETAQLNYLKNDCGVSIIRFWAYPGIGSGASTAATTVNAISAAGMQAIPVICDYSNTCTDLGITGATQSNPTSWYQTEYKGAYKSYATQLKNALGGGVFGIELLNEPHCGGQDGCVTPYSNWVRDMVGVLSGFRVGIGQKASENTTRGDSPGVGSPPDFTVSNAPVGMASAHFYNEAEKALSLQAASQAAALGKTFYIGERGLTCDGAEGSSPGGKPGPSPECTPKQYSLTIEGTVKSSNDFAVVKDAITDETSLINRHSIPEDQWVNYSFVSNQVVNGAIVAIYPSYAFKGSDSYGNVHEYSPGKVGGNLRAIGTINYDRVGPDGTFKLTTSNTCDEVWEHGGWKQYLVVMCPEKQGGSVKTIVKDLYAFPLNKTDAEVDLGDISVDCDADLTVNGRPVPPQSLEYLVRNPNDFLACSNSGELPGAVQPKTKYVNIDLEFNSSEGETNNDSLIYLIENLLKKWLRDKILNPLGLYSFDGVREGFVGVQGLSCDVNSMFTSPVGFYGGIKTDFAELAKYFPAGDPDTYNGFEQKLPLPLCTELRDSSQAVSFTGSNDNFQTSGGMANNLRAPFDSVTTDEDGNTVVDEFGYAARYRRTSKEDLPVCKETSASDAIRHVLVDIAPPESLCGDTNIDGSVDKEDGEMPCPNDPRCGDLNDDGVIVSPETECSGNFSSGVSVIYKYDQRYFPYDALFTGTTEPIGSQFQTRIRTGNDSVSVAYDGTENTGRRIIPFGGGEQTQPDNVSTGVGPGMRFPAAFQSTKFPPLNYGTIYKVGEYGGSEDATANPGSLVLASPTIYGRSVSVNTIRESLSTSSGEIKFDAGTDFYKIGTLDKLCTCSLIEKETGSINGTSVESCIDNAKNVKIAKPLRNFNEYTDAVPAGKKGDYDGFVYNSVSDITNTATALQAGYKYMGEVRNSGNHELEDKYYEQVMADTAIGRFFDSLAEAVSCSVGGWETDANDVTTGRNVECERTISQIAEQVFGSPWFKNLSRIKYNLISTEAVAEPNIVQQKANVIMTCEADVAATKSRTPDEKQGSGLEMEINESAARSVTQATNAVGSPVFYGTSSQCRMVPGWQVSKFEGTMFTVDCLEDGRCWAGGSAIDDDWGKGKTVILPSNDGGLSWGANLGNGSSFVHGINAYQSLQLGAGQHGRTYYSGGSSWSSVRNLIEDGGGRTFTYGGYAYDIAGTPLGGYITTATGYVFYSPDGKNNWKDIYRDDTFPGEGCEARDYPYNCKDLTDAEFNRPDKSVPPACAPPGGVNNCCCYKYNPNPNVDADGDPYTPNCPINARGSGVAPSCWLWGDSSIWGVDCNEATGDCFIAGQKSPKAWYGKSSGGLGNYASWTRYNLNPGGHAMDVSFPINDAVYVVGGSDDDPYNTKYLRNGQPQISKDGWILKTVPGSGNWESKYSLPDAGFFGIDCYDELNCAVAGNFGTVLITADGGETWKDWSDSSFSWAGDPIIEETYKSDKVHFWDIAYPNRNTLVVAGFHVDEGGVIYALGEREDCSELADDGGDDGGGWEDCPSGGCNKNSCSSCACVSLNVSASAGGICVSNPDSGTWGDIRIQWKNNPGGGWGQASLGPGGSACIGGGSGDWEVTSNCVGCQGPCNYGGTI